MARLGFAGRMVRLRIGKSEKQRSTDSAVYRPSVPVNRTAGKRTPLGLPLRFHFREKRIKEFRKTWKTACVAVGLGRLERRPDSKNQKYVDTIVHDLRRCAA